ncbi:histidine phosphatase family protein [Candidatus Nanopelagicales bacterium]|nr:histidine phosphatase family protein [Candidatus Nanopelagicales bacterium]
MIILRHAKAMKRADFDGKDDADRPLSGRGRGEAKRLVDVLDAFGIERIHSSPSKRCTSTVSRFAKVTGVAVAAEHVLSEAGHLADPESTTARVMDIVAQPEPTVVCTHRPVLPTVVNALSSALGLAPTAIHDDPNWDSRLPPGAMIVIHREWTEVGPRAFAVEQHHLPR